MKTKLNVIEIKKSINGEICKWHQGSPAIFLRFAGCNLSCTFCDTRYALDPKSGSKMSFGGICEILESEERWNIIVLTGGEPLLSQKTIIELIGHLYRMGFTKIVIETNGTINPKEVILQYPRVNIVMDCKLPSSGNFHRMRLINFLGLRQDDIIKFPVRDLNDLDYAVAIRNRLQVYVKCLTAVSPIFNKNDVSDQWKMGELLRKVRDNNFIVSVQIHKFLQCY